MSFIIAQIINLVSKDNKLDFVTSKDDFIFVLIMENSFLKFL